MTVPATFKELGDGEKQRTQCENTVVRKVQRTDRVSNLDLEKDLEVYPREMKI